MTLNPTRRHLDNSCNLIMPSKMEVASQHCDTVPNKTKDILYTVKIERIFYIHDSGAPHTVQSSVRGLVQSRSKERFRTVETVYS